MTTHPTPTLFAVPRSRIEELPWETFSAGSGIARKVLYTYGDSTAGLLRLAPGAHELTHLHHAGEHHLWVLSGEMRVDGTLLPAGSYLHVPSHLQHSIEDAGVGSLAFYVYSPAD